MTGFDDTKSKMEVELGGSARQFWHIPARGWWHIIRRTYAQTSSDNLSLIAAGVAFYIFLAFVPLLASIVLLYGLAAAPRPRRRALEQDY